jgi:antitoxin (DNA-binding transcriptional repressor) of toxin-antitoxin stability system
MSDMQVTVSLRNFKRDPRYQRLAHQGAEVLVTKRGKPYLRLLPPARSGSFVGAARAGKPLTADILQPAIPPEDWNAGR